MSFSPAKVKQFRNVLAAQHPVQPLSFTRPSSIGPQHGYMNPSVGPQLLPHRSTPPKDLEPTKPSISRSKAGKAPERRILDSGNSDDVDDDNVEVLTSRPTATSREQPSTSARTAKNQQADEGFSDGSSRHLANNPPSGSGPSKTSKKKKGTVEAPKKSGLRSQNRKEVPPLEELVPEPALASNVATGHNERAATRSRTHNRK